MKVYEGKQKLCSEIMCKKKKTKNTFTGRVKKKNICGNKPSSSA